MERHRAYRDTRNWQWRKLMFHGKPTIAMVNGWCFGGAFTPMICCDLAIAADSAILGLSEINWGIISGGVAPKGLSLLLLSAGMKPTRATIAALTTQHS